MKLLLVAINAKYIHSNPAVYSLRACAGACAEHVEIAEYTINRRTEEIRADIYGRCPDVIAFSCYIWNREQVCELIVDLKKLLPGTDIWVGGPEASCDAEAMLAALPLRGVMAGPGEETFFRLALAYLGGYQSRLPAVYAAPARALDSIPFWYEAMPEEAFANRIVYYESSRGCPFSCSYCLSGLDRRLDFRNVFRVKRELDFFLARRTEQVKFIDRTFNCRKAHALAIWRHILENDNGVTNFHFEIAADLLDEEQLEVLGRMRPGAVQLEIGVQSTNPRTLAAIQRKMDFEKVAYAVRRIQEAHNVHVHLDLIAGLPYEDYESFAKSFNEVYALQPEQLQLGFLKVLKGSLIEREKDRYELLHTEKPPYEVLRTRWLSHDELCRLKRVEEMVEVYHNSRQFIRSLEWLLGCFSSPFAMFEALADWYMSRELLGLSLARVRRYEILRDFVAARKPDGLETFKELLTMDLYLRENMKTRPCFAPDRESHKAVMREWMKEEARTHRYLPAETAATGRDLSHAVHWEYFTHMGEASGLYLFTYRDRDPLTGNGRCLKIEP